MRLKSVVFSVTQIASLLLVIFVYAWKVNNARNKLLVVCIVCYLPLCDILYLRLNNIKELGSEKIALNSFVSIAYKTLLM